MDLRTHVAGAHAGIVPAIEPEVSTVASAAWRRFQPFAGSRLQGAHLTAWQPPVLFTSPNSAFAPGRAIRGGIPIIFPWFGANRHAPAAPQHGFARATTWRLDSVAT
jgi:D-hexose-6-phosphate mutarotase